MRNISFADFFEFEIEGNISDKGITIGDVDNDKNNELVVGSLNGKIYIFKYIYSTNPWAIATDLGMVVCVHIGDICNQGINFLISLSVDGVCHLFNIKSNQDGGMFPKEDIDDVEDRPINLQPCFKQNLPANVKVCLIVDIDGDGLNELVIGYTDRVVRYFKWTSTQTTSKWTTNQTNPNNNLGGSFVEKERWTLAGQIGSISAAEGKEKRLNVMVSQPGGTYVTLVLPKDSNIDEQAELNILPSLMYFDHGLLRTRNSEVSSEIVSNISRQPRDISLPFPSSKYSAICTLDGNLNLIDEEKLLWSLFVGHQLFSVKKLDVTGDGTEEVVVCSWDGKTYIVNLDKQVVRFQFREAVAAFHTGHFATSKDKTSACLVYITFNNRVVLYHNISIPHISCKTLLINKSHPNICLAPETDSYNQTFSKQFISSILYNFNSFK